MSGIRIAFVIGSALFVSTTFVLDAGGAIEASPVRILTFEERVQAQRAIEEVYWRHRIWPKENPGPRPALEEILPDSVIRERVTDYLKKSNALEKLWDRPLTAAQLESETERMARNSRQPEVLREIFAALHDDPFLISECLARPSLADRLLRNWYSFDDRFHGLLGNEARDALARHPALNGEPPEGAEYQEITWRSRLPEPGSTARTATGREISLPPEEYGAQIRRTWIDVGLDPAKVHQVGLSGLPELPKGRFGPLQENEDSFFAKAVIAQETDSMRVGILIWRKTPFKTWWSKERQNFEAVLSPPEENVPPVTVEAPTCADDTWTSISFGPEARYLHTAVWTGSEMLVWGGKDINGVAWNAGFRYSPATDTWTSMSPVNTPSARSGHTAIWTGTLMIIWGGVGTSGAVSTGGRYDPAADTWSPTSTGSNAPGPKSDHTAVWTGSEMIVWGGSPSTNTTSNSGGRYNPSSDSWALTSRGAGVPEPRRLHSAVWTGSEMIVWGGTGGGGFPNPTYQLNSGGRYVPSSDTWSATSMGANVASPRSGHTALWTGTEMIIYGGFSPEGDPIGGARYNPGFDTWSTLNTPLYSVAHHAAVWTGSEMIVWGGYLNQPPASSGPTNLGFRYDPSSDTYVTTSVADAPAARYQHTAVWTGTEMIVWGGTATAALDSGGRYDPLDDNWVPTSRTASPSARFHHSAIWTGAEMVVWGGSGVGPRPVMGGRYVPATDSWSDTNSGSGSVPEGRIFQSAIWTGTEIIVWGGMNTDGVRLNSGGRYNPTTDSWAPTGTGANLPVARADHSAVWTGTRMIIWGGTNSAPVPLNSGALYDPVSDAWMPTGGGVNLPSARSRHTATWTGDRMFIWGGTGSGTPQTTGAKYEPASDSWSTVSTAGAPTSPGGHTAVWTGSEVIVWGSSGPSYDSTGGRYNSTSDTWSPTSTGSGVPAGRTGHSAVWANGEMIVWGGSGSSGTMNTGGRYDPANDTWTPTATGTNVPTPRYYSRAVWTGTEMLVWGGFSPIPLGTGGRYCRQCATYHTHYRDRDLDLFGDPQTTQTTCNSIPLPGFVSTSGDCLDTNPVVYPGAPQICDGANDDCLDASWPAVPANEADGDQDGYRICAGDCDDTAPAVYPDAPQLCDGINNNCSDPTWPAVPANEVDADGDGYRICAGDCDDADAEVWLAPVEVSNLRLSGESPTPLAWDSQSALAGPETVYDLVSGSLGSGVDFATGSCLPTPDGSTYSDFRTDPDVGAGYWYLVRGRNSCEVGTYGSSERNTSIPSCP